jgi:hypothetical protein
MHSKPRHLDEGEFSASHSGGFNSTESEKIPHKSFRVSRENRLLVSSCPSVRPSECISSAPRGMILMKFHIGDFH